MTAVPPLVPHRIYPVDRRAFFRQAAHGFGSLALASLIGFDHGSAQAGSSTPNPLVPRFGHHPARAKNVIFLFMEGGPSHIDLFDPKPKLKEMHGKPLPESFGQVITPMGTGGNHLLASKRTFKQHGESGMWVSDWLPQIATCVDDIALVRACWADGLNHVGSVLQMNTGSILAGRPSLGSWAIYGLGSDNQDLPGFVVLTDGREPVGGARNWGTGFMPASFQGTRLLAQGTPIAHLHPPKQVRLARQQTKLDLITALNAEHQALRSDDSQLAARQAAYELAFRMQAAAPDAVDLRRETEATKQAYGLKEKSTAAFGRCCLLARRLVERGVRFVQIYSGAGSRWDAHSNIESNHSTMCHSVDQPTAALLRDLKARGLLDETLVIWGGEFGRTPMSEAGNGRDHNPFGFSMFFAGGGVRPGQTIGSTDEFGLYGIEDRAHVHDLHATILHLLGFEHTELTYTYGGREERLTINAGKVIDKLVS